MSVGPLLYADRPFVYVSNTFCNLYERVQNMFLTFFIRNKEFLWYDTEIDNRLEVSATVFESFLNAFTFKQKDVKDSIF